MPQMALGEVSVVEGKVFEDAWALIQSSKLQDPRWIADRKTPTIWIHISQHQHKPHAAVPRFLRAHADNS